MLASEVTAQAALLLNDPSQLLWTNTKLLPCLTKANEELELELEIYQIPVQRQVASPVTSVEIGDTELDEYPTDFIEPIKMFERALGSSDGWGEVKEFSDVDANLTTNARIIQWTYRNLKIYINPPTSDREIYLLYTRGLTAVTVAGSTIEVPQAKTYLSARTAQIAALNLGNSPTKSMSLQPDVDKSLDRILRRLGKNKQGVGGSRRKPYKGYKRVVY